MWIKFIPGYLIGWFVANKVFMNKGRLDVITFVVFSNHKYGVYVAETVDTVL